MIDYRINQRIGGGEYSVLATGVTDLTYTVQSITLGVTYEFTVEVRNGLGFSDPSDSVTVLHALPPG